jgi:hypothetical protein
MFSDSNCLFRTLSNQPHHAQLHRNVCVWIERHRALCTVLQRRAQP